jgi:hypothetical protein
MNKRSEAEQVAVWRRHVKIIDTIRDMAQHIVHYQQFGSHVQKKLQAALPEYHVRCLGEYNSYKIQVWGTGLSYDDSPYIGWNIPHGGEHWSKGLDEALNRADPSDSLERYEAEKTILQDLAHLDATIKACKETAERMIGSLPIPPTATARQFRHEALHWSDLSYIRKGQFPNLFGK